LSDDILFSNLWRCIAYNVRRYATFFLRRISDRREQAQKKYGEARAPQRPTGAYSGCAIVFGHFFSKIVA
ncbi:MAG TPA: hypothetical protein DC049_08410, partial [Spirochaetia bacterium]|nr:hypothetical protein [Spirochaetia bacterium]